MANYLTFENIYQTVMKSIADSQYARSDEVKAVVNMVYLNEICQCDELYPLFWLLELDDTKLAKVRAAITGISKANPVVITSVAHGFATDDLVTIYDVGGMVELNNRTYRVVKDTADAIHLHDLTDTNINSSNYTTYTSGGYLNHRGTLITACQKVIQANWHGFNNGLAFIGPAQLEAQSTWWDKSTSRPTKILHRRVQTAAGGQLDYLLWFQASDAAYTLKLWYEKQPDRLANATEVPLLPSQFHDAIVAGSITRLGENKVQVEAGVVWPAIYKAQIEAIKEYNRKRWETQKPFERSGLFLA